MTDLLIINCVLDPSPKTHPAIETDRHFNLSVAESELIKNIKTMAFSLFDLTNLTTQENCHLRYIESDDAESSTSIDKLPTNPIYSLPGVCLHDDSELIQVLGQYTNTNSDRIVLLLAPGPAPKNSNAQIAIKCMCDVMAEHSGRLIEVLIGLDSTRVSDLTDLLWQKLELPAIVEGSEQYYLKTLDWLGDTEKVLNDLSMLCLDVPLKHNDLLVLTRGKLVPASCCLINLWQSRGVCGRMDDVRLEEVNDGVVVNEFVSERSRDFELCGDLMVRNELKLDELAAEVKSKLGIEGEDVNLLMRFMKRLGNGRFQLKKCLFDWNKPLKQLNFKQENDVFVQVISDEQVANLNQGIVLIDCIRLCFSTRLCSRESFKQIAWNVNNGATLSSLKESIAKAYDLPGSDVFRMSIAKRLDEKCQWILLREMNNSGSDASKSKPKAGKKKPGQAQAVVKSNLKLSPFNMDNGDFVAFSLDVGTGQVTAEDFMSMVDLENETRCKLDAERIRKERSERRSNLAVEGGGKGDQRTRRPEVGISIRIDDFSV